MSKIVLAGNVALFEFPECETEPEFNYEDGILFVFGYVFNLAGKSIRAAKRFDLDLHGYDMLGEIKTLNTEQREEISELLQNFGTDNILVFINQNPEQKERV